MAAVEFIQSNMHLLGEPAGGEERRPGSVYRRESAASVLSTMSGLDTLHLHTVNHMVQRWWGGRRIDYALYCPEGLANFPAQVLPHLFHASYWESQDAIAFILRNVRPMRLGAVNYRLHSVKCQHNVAEGRKTSLSFREVLKNVSRVHGKVTES